MDSFLYMKLELRRRNLVVLPPIQATGTANSGPKVPEAPFPHAGSLGQFRAREAAPPRPASPRSAPPRSRPAPPRPPRPAPPRPWFPISPEGGSLLAQLTLISLSLGHFCLHLSLFMFPCKQMSCLSHGLLSNQFIF